MGKTCIRNKTLPTRASSPCGTWLESFPFVAPSSSEPKSTNGSSLESFRHHASFQGNSRWMLPLTRLNSSGLFSSSGAASANDGFSRKEVWCTVYI